MDSSSLNKILYSKAVQLLAQRNHSTVELKQKLSLYATQKSDQDSDNNLVPLTHQIDAVIQYCLLKHWLDDDSYINQYIDIRIRKGYGKNRIIMELRQRGLDNNRIVTIMQQKEIDWCQLALTQVKKKFLSINLRDIRQKSKVNQFLLYRGFCQEEIRYIFTLFR